MASANWDEAFLGFGLSAGDVQSTDRLLDVNEHLSFWREPGDRLQGTLAAVALDAAPLR